MPKEKSPEQGLTLTTIFQRFATDEAAREFLEKYLWPYGPTCPRCYSNDPARVYVMSGDSARPGVRNCKECRRQFTVTVGTIFEDSHIPLRKWVIAWYLLNASKKGVSSLQLQRMLELGSYRTALFMTHRIRHALKDASFPEPLKGIVEIDETYVGGKRPKGQGKQGRPGVDSHKVPVVSLVERGGNKRSMMMRVTAENLKAAVVENVQPGSTVVSDAFPMYKRIPKDQFTHHVVNHREKEYARREGDMVAHTNTVEGSFSLLKRGIVGTFHHVSKQHLHLYLAEFDHRWNYRKTTDGERTVAGLLKARGKRLQYKAMR